MKRTILTFAAILQQLAPTAYGHGRPVTATVLVLDRCAGAAHRLGVPLDGIARVFITY